MTELFSNETMTIEGADWHELRLQNIGGSEVAGLFDVQADYQLSRYGLYMVKSRLVVDDFDGNERTVWGNRLEDAIAQGAAEENGWEIRKGGYFRSPNVQGMGSTLDYVILEHPEHHGPGALEIKNVDGIIFSEKWNGEPPIHILLQLQHQLACSGFGWGIIAALVGGNTLKVYHYDARTDIIQQIENKVAQFWHDVANENKPPVDASDNTGRIIRALNSPVQKTTTTSNDEELHALCIRFDETHVAKKSAEEAHKLVRNQIAEKVGAIQKTNIGGFTVSQTVLAAKEPRMALPGEIISGRAESRRLAVKSRK